MADVKQDQQMIPLITCEIPFGQDVCELVFGVDVFDLDFGVQINSIEQPIKSNSVGSGNMSHCPQTHAIKLLDARIGHLKEQNKCLSLHRFSCEAYDVCEHHSQVSLILSETREICPKTETIRSHSSRAGKPSNLSPVSR